jgi:transposase
MGIESVVIDAASVEVSRRARRVKTDRLDAEMLVAKLVAHHRGERAFAVVRIPTPEDEGARHEQRHLDELKVERGRLKMRIGALLLTEGIAAACASTAIESLDTLKTIDGRALAPKLIKRLRDESERLQIVQKQIDAIEEARKQALKERKKAHNKDLSTQGSETVTGVERVWMLSSLKGIGPTGAFKLILECFGWRKFKTRREVAGCLGLAPSPFASGNMDREQGISKLGNPRLRSLLIELSWLWLKYQPTSAITLWFENRFARGAGRARRIGIVGVARKLAIALWKFIEFGVVPDGAIMKT